MYENLFLFLEENKREKGGKNMYLQGMPLALRLVIFPEVMVKRGSPSV